MLSNQGGFYSTFAYVSETRRLGITILPPDVNHSQVRWTGREQTVRVGLVVIKGLSATTQAHIVSQRATGPYTTLTDFLERVCPDEEEARALIYSGACDALAPGQDQAALLWVLARWRQARTPGRSALFSSLPEDPAPDLPPGTELERLRRQFSVLGFLCDCHPMVLFADTLAPLQLVKAVDLPCHLWQEVRLAGWLLTGKVVSTRQGEPMEFLTFEDETGVVETTFFPEAYRRFCHLLDTGRPYVLSGQVEEEYGAVTLTVHQVHQLPRLQEFKSPRLGPLLSKVQLPF